MNTTLIYGDCLEKMEEIPDNSVDMILTDPPYGTTSCKWDSIIPFEPMWEQLKRITKKNRAIVLFGSQPFTSALIMSNPKMFKYEWIWNKITARGHLVAKYRPMAQHENILVFGCGKVIYNPQMTLKEKPEKGASVESSRTSIMGGKTTKEKKYIIRTHSYPKTIQIFKMDKRIGHPTQKPVALGRYLIRTYTNKGDTILDFTAGSGSFGVSAILESRNFIGIENNKKYFQIMEERINQIKEKL